MIQQSLVPEEKSLKGHAVTIQCANGDVALYPLADVELEIEGMKVQVQAAISEELPVWEQMCLYWKSCWPNIVTSNGVKEVLVMTRQEKQSEEVEGVENRTSSTTKSD